MDNLQSKVVSDTHLGLRADACALALFPSLGSRSQAKKWIKRSCILLNDHPTTPAHFVQIGDRMTLRPDTRIPKPLDIDIDIVHEDDSLIVVNKPAGLFISGRHPKTLVRALRRHARLSLADDALPFAQPVHRLDQRTSGLVICAKTRQALITLGKTFENRRIKKQYRAIVCGHLDSGESSEPIEGKDAYTTWTPIQHVRSLHTEWLTELSVQIHTGRNHQIRRHLGALGHPILGDDLYTNGPVLKSKGLFLCAVKLEFPHPIQETLIQCTMDPPAKFQNQLAREAQRWQKYHP